MTTFAILFGVALIAAFIWLRPENNTRDYTPPVIPTKPQRPDRVDEEKTS